MELVFWKIPSGLGHYCSLIIAGFSCQGPTTAEGSSGYPSRYLCLPFSFLQLSSVERTLVWREADTRARNLGLLSLAEGAVGRHSGTLGEGTEGALPGLAASPVETCRSQPGKKDRGHSRENTYIMPLASQSSGGSLKKSWADCLWSPRPRGAVDVKSHLGPLLTDSRVSAPSGLSRWVALETSGALGSAVAWGTVC